MKHKERHNYVERNMIGELDVPFVLTRNEDGELQKINGPIYAMYKASVCTKCCYTLNVDITAAQKISKEKWPFRKSNKRWIYCNA